MINSEFWINYILFILHYILIYRLMTVYFINYFNEPKSWLCTNEHLWISLIFLLLLKTIGTSLLTCRKMDTSLSKTHFNKYLFIVFLLYFFCRKIAINNIRRLSLFLRCIMQLLILILSFYQDLTVKDNVLTVKVNFN